MPLRRRSFRTAKSMTQQAASGRPRTSTVVRMVPMVPTIRPSFQATCNGAPPPEAPGASRNCQST